MQLDPCQARLFEAFSMVSEGLSAKPPEPSKLTFNRTPNSITVPLSLTAEYPDTKFSGILPDTKFSGILPNSELY